MYKLFLASGTLYLLSVTLGIWAAYDRESALVRSSWLIAGTLVAMALNSLPLRRRRIIFRLCIAATVLAVLVGIYYLAQVLGSFDLGNDQVTIRLYDNAAAGVLIILLPVGLGSSLLLWSRRHRTSSIVFLLLLGVSLVALLVTESRGALVGLAAGLVLTLYAVWRSRSRTAPWLTLLDASLVLFVATGIAVYGAIAFGGVLDEQLGVVEWSGSPGSRIELWRDTLPLLQDYLFTGSGLGSTAMVYSTYAFDLHVPFYYHAHNLYLQLVLEQGMLGLVGFVGMSLAGGWMLWAVMTASGGEARIVAAVTFCALTALLVHGLFDAELYVSPMAVVMFVPLALATSLHGAVADQNIETQGNVAEPAEWMMRESVYPVAAALIVVVLSIVMVTPQGRAAVYANLGAVLQTRAELGEYEWSVYPNQEAVRKAFPERLDPAVVWYQRALQTDPKNATAIRRLGQIALSLGEHRTPLTHLAASFQIAPDR